MLRSKKRKSKREDKKKRKIETTKGKVKIENLARKLKPTPKELLWLIIGALIGAAIGPIFAAYINPIILPMIAPEPGLIIMVFQSHAPYANGTNVYGVPWSSRYAEYVIMIQQNMSKTKSTPVDDVYLVIDFDAAILAVHEELIEGITNPSIKVGGGVLIVADGEIISDVKYVELIVDLERLKPGGCCALAVVVDPDYEGSLARLHIVPSPTRRYFGSYHYDAYGIEVKNSVSGSIPTLAE